MHRFTLLAFAAILLSTALLTGCSAPGEAHAFRQEALEFVLEAPLFEGPNSGQIAWAVELPSALGLAEGKRVTGARLVHATVQPGDSLGFSQVRSLVLSFASDNADIAMQEAGFKNPVDPHAERVELEVASDAELGDHVAAGKAYLVLDVDLAEDAWEEGRRFLLDFTLEITIK